MNRAKEQLAKVQEALSEAKGKVSPSEHIVRVTEVRQRMESDDPDERYQARSLAKAAFQNLIARITFDPDTGLVIVVLVEALGAMYIHSDGSTGYLDLVTGGRQFSATETIDGFIRRRDGRSLTSRRA